MQQQKAKSRKLKSFHWMKTGTMTNRQKPHQNTQRKNKKYLIGGKTIKQKIHPQHNVTKKESVVNLTKLIQSNKYNTIQNT